MRGSIGTVMRVLAGLILSASSLAAQTEVNRRRAVAPDASIRLQGEFGSVRVIGWDQDSVALTGAVPAGTRVEAAWGDATSGPSRGAKIFIESPAKMAGMAPGKTGSLELRVPRRVRLWVKAGSAIIDVSGVTGGLDLNIVGGSVRVSGSPRELRAESMDGDVRVEGKPEWMRLKTATGDITLSGGGGDVGVSTVSGAVRVTEGALERLRVENVSGLILMAGTMSRGGVMDVDSHSGPVELRLPFRADAEVDVISLTGRIDNYWNSAKPIAGREGRGQELGTVSGTPSARITVRSFKGTVTLRADKRG